MFRTIQRPPLLRSSATIRRPFASRPDFSSEDVTTAREWLSNFNSTSIPRHIGEISFSRSGGPGGQNVNKVNSKATLKTSRYYAARTNSLVIQAEESRKQTANIETCYDKLYQLLKNTAKDLVPGETTAKQRDRVQKLKKAANESRIRDKKLHSSKKSNRRGGGDD